MQIINSKRVDMDSWYLLHTKPRIETRVTFFLEQKGIRVFLPQLSQTNTKGQTRKKAFFPGYLFASLDLDSIDPSIRHWTPGLRYIVKYGDEPVPVSDEIITLITQQIGRLELLASSPNHQFEPGDMVRIKDGPFEDLIAIFEGPTYPATRVQVLLSTLNRAIRLDVEVANLEKAPNQAVEATIRRPRRTRGRGRRIL